MIRVSSYTLIPRKEDNHYTVFNKEMPLCPDCRTVLIYYDSRPRRTIGGDGIACYIHLRRLRCPSCGKLHLEIPDFITPYKHYDTPTIQAARKNQVFSCPADDSTIRRWRKLPPTLPVE